MAGAAGLSEVEAGLKPAGAGNAKATQLYRDGYCIPRVFETFWKCVLRRLCQTGEESAGNGVKYRGNITALGKHDILAHEIRRSTGTVLTR
jgi:hypothetical protein